MRHRVLAYVGGSPPQVRRLSRPRVRVRNGRSAEHMTALFNATLIVPLPDPATEQRKPGLFQVGAASSPARRPFR
jgi:hypothetical protein